MESSPPIVVATDFSKPAERAIAQAGALARRLGCPLEVVHTWNTGVWKPDLFSGEIPLEPLMSSARAAATESLDRAVAALCDAGCDARAVFEEGIASRAIPQHAERVHARLIVVGRRGSARLSHVLLGSVSERIVRGAGCPVLVVPMREEEPRVPRRLLVGIDFSASSREALRIAAQFDAALGCASPLLLAHAFQDERADWLASWSETGLADRKQQSLHSVEAWAREQLGPQAEFECRLVVGTAEESLPEAARSDACDWVVIGLQGRTALATFLMGSTTRRVLELTDRPVLVVPARTAPDREAVG